MVEMFNPTEKLELLAASASEIHAAAAGEHGKLRVDFKSDEDRNRKRQLRLLKNRQSAALSRQRKKEYITDLEERTNGLITENHDLVQKIAKLSSMNLEFKMHIDSLEKSLNETKNENNELRARLASINGGSTSSIPSSPNNNNNNNTNNTNNNNTNNSNNNSNNTTTTTSSINTTSTTTITTTSTSTSISISPASSSLSSPPSSLSTSSSSSIISEENPINSPPPVQDMSVSP